MSDAGDAARAMGRALVNAGTQLVETVRELAPNVQLPERSSTEDPNPATATVNLRFEPLHLPGVAAVELQVNNIMITQQFSSHYTPEEVYGRMDPIATFKNVKRSLSFNFKLVKSLWNNGAQAVTDNAKNINKVVQFLYPAYTGDHFTHRQTIKAPPFFRLTYSNFIGNYADAGRSAGSTGLSGYITNFSMNLGNIPEEFTIGANGTFLPMKYGVSFTFNAIHEEFMGWTMGDEFGRVNPEVYTFGGGLNFPYNYNGRQAPWSAEDDPDPDPETPGADEESDANEEALDPQ
jgi:hypothetical protein